MDQGVTRARGFVAGAVSCAIKDGSTKPDLAVILSPTRAVAAGVFTQNKAAAAPVIVSRERIKSHRASAVVVNSGNANACTGPAGLEDANAMAAAVARRFDLEVNDVLVFSTGVIGVPMPMDRIITGIDRIALSDTGGLDFAHAIMTTDTCRKTCSVERIIGGVTVRIGGTAKGSGMIHPNMATLLGFITSDANVEPAFLQASLVEAVDQSFNAISVDGDTSTNDSVVVLANGIAGGVQISADHPEARRFTGALSEVCVDLAKQLVRDGEGARTLIEIRVDGARNNADARSIARSVSRSNLVKTAVFGGDPNWGRVICAAGYAEADFDPDRATLYLNEICLFRDGLGLPYSKQRAASLLREPDVTFTLSLGLGDGSGVAWGCDMSYEYVRINAEYTT